MAKGTRISAGYRRTVQVRKERKDAFNDAKKQVYLDHLASCCTVTTAAAAAGVSPETVNYHRRNDPVFDQQCEEALKVGYDALDAAMLARAARGGHYTPGPGAADAPGAETLDTELGLHLLSLRRKPIGQRTGRAGYEPKRATVRQVNDSILAKLDVLHRRLKLKRAEVRKLKSPKDVAAAAAEQGQGEQRGPSRQALGRLGPSSG